LRHDGAIEISLIRLTECVLDPSGTAKHRGPQCNQHTIPIVLRRIRRLNDSPPPRPEQRWAASGESVTWH